MNKKEKLIIFLTVIVSFGLIVVLGIKKRNEKKKNLPVEKETPQVYQQEDNN